ncbi:HAAS signaling domain-containing protein [Streptomyces sp. NPDC029674]|uniref:HAAS signaling domain-containing protein n=1 Tax=Streptomyces sp. NPDC029674 TaxID=3365297 RepID=UPI003850E09C
MGIESDQLVYDYLSRVGDLAQQRQLPSGDRMRLVAELRNRIDRGRSRPAGDSPAAVRRILARLGTPEEVVEAAGGAGDETVDLPSAEKSAPAVPKRWVGGARPASSGARSSGLPKSLRRRIVPGPRREHDTQEPSALAHPADFEGASPPHLAGTDELGPSGSEPDWWRVDSSPFGVADSVPGFVGGVEIPEILKPPPKEGKDGEDDPEAETEEDEADETVEYGEGADAYAEEGAKRRWWRPGRRAGAGSGTGLAFSNPLLLLAAALLTVGAVLGNLVVLGVGWLITYVSRRLSPAEVKIAVLWLPGLAVAAGITWLWGRAEGRWEPLGDGRMSDAVADTWPWVVRGAAVASALFLLWRSQRRRP